jgi:alpha-aminoadipate/glutamate carrier protein LysW
MVLCPECENDLDLDEDEVEEGDVVSCLECGTNFEVVTADPIELHVIAEEGEEDADEIVAEEDEE